MSEKQRMKAAVKLRVILSERHEVDDVWSFDRGFSILVCKSKTAHQIMGDFCRLGIASVLQYPDPGNPYCSGHYIVEIGSRNYA